MEQNVDHITLWKMCKLLTFNSKIPVHFILFLGVLKYKKKEYS